MRQFVPVSVALVLASLGTMSLVSAQQTERHVFVTVLDQAGAPMLDLGPDDFRLQEDGLARPIVRASLTNEPMRVAVLVDNSEAADRSLTHIRAGLNTFLETLPAEHEMTLITIARQLRVRAEPTVDRKKLQEAANLIFIDSGSGAVLLDALLETDKRFLQKAEARWPIFVIVTTDGPEGSRRISDNAYNAFVGSLLARGVIVHAILMSTRGGGFQTQLATNLTQNTQGHYEAIAASTGLPDKLRELAGLMAEQHAKAATQYQVTFTSDSTNQQAAIRVSVARPAGDILVSMGRTGP